MKFQRIPYIDIHFRSSVLDHFTYWGDFIFEDKKIKKEKWYILRLNNIHLLLIHLEISRIKKIELYLTMLFLFVLFYFTVFYYINLPCIAIRAGSTCYEQQIQIKKARSVLFKKRVSFFICSESCNRITSGIVGKWFSEKKDLVSV